MKESLIVPLLSKMQYLSKWKMYKFYKKDYKKMYKRKRGINKN